MGGVCAREVVVAPDAEGPGDDVGGPVDAGSDTAGDRDTTLGPDVPTPETCEPGTARCDGDDSLVCGPDGVERRSSCTSASRCTSPLGCRCDDGLCVERVCPPGRTRCEDGVAERCAADGSGFEAISDCDAAGQTCVDGTCLDSPCTGAGATCAGETVVVCNDALEIVDTLDCGRTNAICVDAACVPQVCAPGTLRCAGGDRAERCDARGAGWIETPCDEGEACIDGQCAEIACEPGSVTCADAFTRFTCDETGQDGDPSPCPTGQRCIEASGTCTPFTCPPSTSRCTAGEREVCANDGSGYVVSPCASDEACIDGACVTTICEPGSRTCLNATTLQTCGPTGTSQQSQSCPTNQFCDAVAGACAPRICTPGAVRCAGERGREICREPGDAWVGTETCAAESICMEGACTAIICEPGTAICTNDTTRGVCNDNGTARTPSACGSAQFCLDGACRDAICTPGSAVCDGDFARRVCNALGSAQTTQSCAAGQHCNAGACVANVCVPSSVTCTNATTLSTCNAAGSGSSTTTCGASEVCFDNACRPRVCEPGTATCLGDGRLSRCNESGTATVVTSCGAGTACDAGACEPIICAPGTRFCDGAGLRQCNASGTGSSLVTTCATGCEDGACTDPFCGDGIIQTDRGEQCDDGNDLTCDGCESCRVLSHLVVSGTTRTTNTPTWVPGSSNLTVEGWFNVTGSGTLVGIGDFIPGNQNADYAALFVAPDGRPAFRVYLGGTAEFTVRGQESVVDEGWVHLAGVRTGVRSLRLYVNGRLVDVVDGGGNFTTLDGTGNIWVASRAGTNATVRAVGQYDEIRISNTAMYTTPYHAPQRRLGTSASTIAMYRFDGLGNERTSDSAGSRNLTLADATFASDACFGADPGSESCGDGDLAPWEVCDPGETSDGADIARACNDACERVCANDLRSPNGGCYIRFTQNRNFDQARTACRDLGGDLATIRNPGVSRVFTSQYNWTSGWIGLTTRPGVREWRWVDDGSPLGDWTNWASGEPNNAGGNENCVSLTSGAWNDTACNQNRASVCEIP